MKPKITVIGSANTDMTVRVRNLPKPGETVLGNAFCISQGGKGANQAVAAARLGADVSFVTRLGRDVFGQESASSYRKDGLDLTFLVWDDCVSSGVALILVDDNGENVIAVAPGANSYLLPRDVEAAEPAIQASDCILLQLEIPLECVEAAAILAKKHDKYVVLNPAPATQLPPELVKRVDLLTPNETEFAIITGIAAETLYSNDAIIDDFRNTWGIKNFIVTMGSQGALMVANHKKRLIPGYPVTIADTTGAGDAFNGGLVVALARGDDLESAIHFANAVGALSTTKAGAQSSLPSLKDVTTFLQSTT